MNRKKYRFLIVGLSNGTEDLHELRDLMSIGQAELYWTDCVTNRNTFLVLIADGAVMYKPEEIVKIQLIED